MAYGLALKGIVAASLSPLIRIPTRTFSTAVITQTTRFREDPTISIPIGTENVELDIELNLREDRIRNTQNVASLITAYYGAYYLRREVLIPRTLAREAAAVGVAKAGGKAATISKAKWLVRGGSKALGWLAIADTIVLGVTYGIAIFDEDGSIQPTTLTGEIFDALFGDAVREEAQNQIERAIDDQITARDGLFAVLAFYLDSISVSGRVELDGFSIGKIFSMSLVSSLEEGLLDIELTDLCLYVIGVVVAHAVLRSWVRFWQSLKKST